MADTVNITTALTSKWAGAHTSIRVSAKRHEPEHHEFDRYATIVIETGACGIQTYADAEACRALAAALIAGAIEVERMAAEDAERVAA